jgi:hypothetical protein
MNFRPPSWPADANSVWQSRTSNQKLVSRHDGKRYCKTRGSTLKLSVIEPRKEQAVASGLMVSLPHPTRNPVF